MINVTKTHLPELDEYVKYLERIWASGWVTNNGELVRELETRLAEFLGVPHVIYVSNGTIALQLALKALEVHGEVITTPFSYVATTNSILWQGCQPVYVDIDLRSLCLDPTKIEQAITPQTKAILGVHVYGYPCDVNALAGIATKHNLPILYDAAHAFATRFEGTSILNYGDLSTLSFHATKLFHTIEGGAIIAHSPEMAEKIHQIKSFGHIGDEYHRLGINAKNSEFHAAMGLCMLPKVGDIILKRREICSAYDEDLRATGVCFSPQLKHFDNNFAYYPILLENYAEMLRVKQALNSNQIYPRRYFYPSLNQLPFLQTTQSCPIAEDVSSRVLCLPLFDSLDCTEVHRITALIKEALQR